MRDSGANQGRRCGAIVLAGGRSTRMGASKAALDWHGVAMVRRVTGLVARGVEGPVVVVAAPDQDLPALDASVEIVRDVREGCGPLEGLRAGMTALAGRVEVAYASATDVPLLHPRLVALVVAALGAGQGEAPGDSEIALPTIDGHRQFLAGAYRTSLLPRIEALLADGERRLGRLAELSRLHELDRRTCLADPELARLDPALDSLRSLDGPAAYAEALRLPAPEVTVAVRLTGDLTTDASRTGTATVHAWTVADAAREAAVTVTDAVEAVLGATAVTADGTFPLVSGDAVILRRKPQPQNATQAR